MQQFHDGLLRILAQRVKAGFWLEELEAPPPLVATVTAGGVPPLLADVTAGGALHPG